MAPQSTEAVVLKVVPFKESSLILHLFTKEHGLVHAVAKGVKSNRKGTNYIERGFLIEIVLYSKPNRDLDTAGAITILDYYDETRKNIVKSALRDSAFEVVLAVIHHRDEHFELFNLFVKFLTYLNSHSEMECYPSLLWLFYYRLIENLGFAFDICNCSKCGVEITTNATLNIADGGVECSRCNQNLKQNIISIAALNYLRKDKITNYEIVKTVPNSEIEITNLSFVDFIRYHFDIKHELNSLSFLHTII